MDAHARQFDIQVRHFRPERIAKRKRADDERKRAADADERAALAEGRIRELEELLRAQGKG